MTCPYTATYPSIDGAQDPYPFYAYLRTEAPVYQEPGTNRYLLSRREHILHVLGNPQLFSSVDKVLGVKTQVPGSAMIGLDPPEHKPARDIGFLPFKPGRLRSHEVMIREVADRLIDKFVGDGHVELFRQFAAPLSADVTCNLLGLPTEGLDDLYRHAAAVSTGSGIAYLPDDDKQVSRESWAKMTEFVGSEVTARVTSPRDDALSDMLKLQLERDGHRDVQYVLEQAVTVLLGGITTTAHLIANAMASLLQAPDQLAKLQANHRFLPKMIEEAMRLESPAQWIPRRVT